MVAGADHPTIARRRARPDGGIERHRIAGQRHIAREGQVRLIDVARANIALHRVEGDAIVRLLNHRPQRADLHPGRVRQHRRQRAGRDQPQPFEQTEPQERRSIRPLVVATGDRCQPFLQRQPGLIAHIARDMQSRLARVGDTVERWLHLLHPMRGDDRHGIAIEPRSRGVARAGIIEQGKDFGRAGKTHGRVLTGFARGERPIQGAVSLQQRNERPTPCGHDRSPPRSRPRRLGGAPVRTSACSGAARPLPGLWRGPSVRAFPQTRACLRPVRPALGSASGG